MYNCLSGDLGAKYRRQSSLESMESVFINRCVTGTEEFTRMSNNEMDEFSTGIATKLTGTEEFTRMSNNEMDEFSTGIATKLGHSSENVFQTVTTENNENTKFNKAEELSTYRHKFIKKLPRSSVQDRQKWLARDVLYNDTVALHKIASDYNDAGSFGNSADSKSFCRRSSFRHLARGKVTKSSIEMNREFFREVILMRCLRKSPHILFCHGFVLDNQKNLYISTENFGEMSLKRFQDRSVNQILPEETVKDISRQLLSALEYIHSIRICHNDLNASNVAVKHDHLADRDQQEGKVQVKVGNFHKARDFSVWVECRREFECFKCRAVSKIDNGTNLATNTFHAMRCDPSYDMMSFGHLVFRMLRGCTPWIKVCTCDVHYLKHCKRLARLSSSSENKEFEQRSSEVSPGSANSTEAYQLVRNKIKKNVKGNVKKDPRKSWKTFNRKFSRCLDLLLSNDYAERPSARQLLAGRSDLSRVFAAESDGGIQLCSRPRGHKLIMTCVYSQTL